jgi:hypothetical protein
MVPFNLGGGAVAFEIEGDADRVGSPDPTDLLGRWPLEMVENYRRYRERTMQFDASAHSPVVVTENPSSSDEGK